MLFQHIRRFWLESESHRKLLQATDDLAIKQKSTNKIVCLGLGAFNHDKAFYGSSLQHGCFTIGKQLEKAY